MVDKDHRPSPEDVIKQTYDQLLLNPYPRQEQLSIFAQAIVDVWHPKGVNKWDEDDLATLRNISIQTPALIQASAMLVDRGLKATGYLTSDQQFADNLNTIRQQINVALALQRESVPTTDCNYNARNPRAVDGELSILNSQREYFSNGFNLMLQRVAPKEEIASTQ